MKKNLLLRLVLTLGLAGAVAGEALASCGSAFCSVNSDLASETLGIGEGSVFDLRYEHIKQDQPRTGSRRIGVGEIRHHHDEVSTLNRNLIATYTRNFASGWGVSVTAPLVDRHHVHIHNHGGGQIFDSWDFRELGDVRVVGRFQKNLDAGQEAPRVAGLSFGLKLPTGRTGVANGNGEAAERSLQPGTGTTDAILGAFFHQPLPQRNASWFAQLQYQQPLNTRDNYRAGAQFTADLGYSQKLAENLAGIVQLNAVVKRRDRGSEAEPDDSGSRALFLSPGLSYQLTEQTRWYGFYQHPLHQSVNGVQLTAGRGLVVGFSTRF